MIRRELPVAWMYRFTRTTRVGIAIDQGVQLVLAVLDQLGLGTILDQGALSVHSLIISPDELTVHSLQETTELHCILHPGRQVWVAVHDLIAEDLDLVSILML